MGADREFCVQDESQQTQPAADAGTQKAQEALSDSTGDDLSSFLPCASEQQPVKWHLGMSHRCTEQHHYFGN